MRDRNEEIKNLISSKLLEGFSFTDNFGARVTYRPDFAPILVEVSKAEKGWRGSALFESGLEVSFLFDEEGKPKWYAVSHILERTEGE